MKTFEEFFKEQTNLVSEDSLGRIWQHVNSPDRPVGIISAFRKEYDRSTNIQRNKNLAAKIFQAGYGYFYVEGSWIEDQGKPTETRVKEDSIFVVGKPGDTQLQNLLHQWGNENDQDAIIYKPAGTTTAIGVNKDGSTFTAGDWHPNRITEFMTFLKGGKGTFAFEGVVFDKNWIGKLAEARTSQT